MEIRAVAQVGAPGPGVMMPSASSVSLPALLVDIVRQARQPLTPTELTAAIVRSKYPTKSKDLKAMVETRVAELVRKGVLKRTSDRTGVILGNATSSAFATSTVQRMSKNGQKKTDSAKPSAHGSKKIPLKDLVARVLARSPQPLTSQQLADKVLASGYKTKSKNFLNVLWVGIGNMKNVEHVKGAGYRLKK